MIEIEEEKLQALIEALKKATHKDFENCSAEVCQQITKALKALGA